MPAVTIGRIRTRAAFRELQRSRARASSGPVRAIFARADAADPGVFPQVGYAIGKHCGNAVVRNSLRRRMRESARSVADSLPRGTYLLRVEPAAAHAAAAALSANVREALLRAGQSDRGRP